MKAPLGDLSVSMSADHPALFMSWRAWMTGARTSHEVAGRFALSFPHHVSVAVGGQLQNGNRGEQLGRMGAYTSGR